MTPDAPDTRPLLPRTEAGRRLYSAMLDRADFTRADADGSGLSLGHGYILAVEDEARHAANTEMLSRTWRGRCGHVWDVVDDGPECPRCACRDEMAEARSREAALLDAAKDVIALYDSGEPFNHEDIDALRTAVARAALAPEPPDETFWLIERGQSMGQQPTVWWTGLDWSSDAFEATRYPNRERAEAFIEERSGFGIPSHGGPTGSRFGIAVEHAFIPKEVPVENEETTMETVDTRCPVDGCPPRRAGEGGTGTRAALDRGQRH